MLTIDHNHTLFLLSLLKIKNTYNMSTTVTELEQEEFLEKLKVFKIKDRDKKFAVLYIHTGVQRSENFAGISSLRSVYQ